MGWRLTSAALGAAWIQAAVAGPQGGVLEDFEAMPLGSFWRVESALGPLECRAGEPGVNATLLVIHDSTQRGGESGKLLRILAGEDGGPVTVTLSLEGPALAGETLAFRARRVSARPDFGFTVSALGDGDRRSHLDLGEALGRDALEPCILALPEGATVVEFRLSSAGRIGVLLDDLERRTPRPMTIDTLALEHASVPIVAGRDVHVATLRLGVSGALDPLTLRGVRLSSADPAVAPSALTLRVGDRTLRGAPEAEPDGEEGERPWWRVPCGLGLVPGPFEAEIRGSFGATETPGLDFDPGVMLRCEVMFGDGEWRLVPAGPSASGVVSEVLVGRDAGLAIDATALGAIGVGPRSAGSLVGAVGLVEGEGRAFVRVYRWTEEGQRTSFDVASERDLFRPTILVDRIGGTVLIALEARGRGAAPDAPTDLLVLRSSDGGVTFTDPEPLEVVDDDDVGHIGGHVRLGGGRGVIDSTGAWALPILRSFGHPSVAAALLVSKDEGRTWSVSTGVLTGARSVAVIALGEGSLLIDAARGPSALRDEAATLNVGVWWNDMHANARPGRPASPAGTSYVHIGRDTGWGPDSRLVLATAPDERNVGLSLRGTNDYGAIWHEARRRVVDEREGAGAPAIALVDNRRLVLLLRSGDGELLLQVHDVRDYGAPLKSVGELFGPR